MNTQIKYSPTTNRFYEVATDSIDITVEAYTAARNAQAAGLPFIVLDGDTVTVAPTVAHKYYADRKRWIDFAYMYSPTAAAFYPLDMLNMYAELPSDLIMVTRDVHTSAINTANAGVSYVIKGDGESVSVAPSAAHDWNAKKSEWVLNKERAAALEAQAIKDAVPKLVTMAQAQLALLRFELLDDVEAAMLTDAVPREAKIWWTKSTVVRRDDAIVAMMAGLLGLSDEQLDTMFTMAAIL